MPGRSHPELIVPASRVPLPTRALDKKLAFALTLADHHHCWCAWCFDYIKTKDELEGHHIWPSADLAKLLVGERFPKDCLVPVHKRVCHREELQDRSNTAGRFLLEARKLAPDDFDETCRRAFFDGDLTRKLFLHEWARRRCAKQNDQAGKRQNLVFELNALAGSSLGPLLAQSSPHAGPSWLDRMVPPKTKDRELLVYSGSELVNSGRIWDGWQRYQGVLAEAPRVRKLSSKLYAKVARVRAIVTFETKHSKEALELSEEDKYTLRTALLSSGWSKIKVGDYTGARDAFDSITSWVVGDVSWWHRAEQEFGVGCTMYLEHKAEKLKEALERLLRAQYIFALLALQGTPVPDPREVGHPGPVRVTPTEVILWIAQDYGAVMSLAYMTDLRKEALRYLKDSLLEILRRENYSLRGG